MILNIGAAAPVDARRVAPGLLEIDGETVVRLMPDIGYMAHRD